MAHLLREAAGPHPFGVDALGRRVSVETTPRHRGRRAVGPAPLVTSGLAYSRDVRVLLLNSDEGGCGWYRMLYPGLALAKEPDLEIADGRTPYVATDYDVVVFQKPFFDWRVKVIPELKRRGIAVVVEVDDDYWNLDRRNPAYNETRTRTEFHVKHLTYACEQADLVTVSTPTLARVIKNRTRVLRNCVPERYLTLAPDPDIDWAMSHGRTIVGWSGDPAYHPGDLPVVRDLVPRVTRESGAVFLGIGSDETWRQLGFRDGESLYIPWGKIERYPAIVAGIDVGIIPLAPTPFNDAKSWLKGIEYSSLGIPFVASPSAEYRELHALGAGALARKPREWLSELRALLASPARQEELGEAGRAVARELTYEKNAWRWAEAWREAYEIARRRCAS